MPSESRLALFIDADNEPPWSALGTLNRRLANHGLPVERRAYAAKSVLQPWTPLLERHGIRPFPEAGGRNATDLALTIGAMDVLHEGDVEAFCIASSDADYAPLARRIKAAGKTVVFAGIGSKVEKVIQPLVDEFIDTAALQPDAATDEDLQCRLVAACAATARTDGWSLMSEVGTRLKADGIDYHMFGRTDLKPVLRDTGHFELVPLPDRIRPLAPIPGPS